MQYELTFIAKKDGVEHDRQIFAGSDLGAVQAAVTKISVMGDLGSNFKLFDQNGREIALPCPTRAGERSKQLAHAVGNGNAEKVLAALREADAYSPIIETTAVGENIRSYAK